MFARKTPFLSLSLIMPLGTFLFLNGVPLPAAHAQSPTADALRRFILAQPHLPERPSGEVDSGASTTTEVDGKQIISTFANETMNFAELSGLNPNANVLYPGSLVQGRGLMTGTLSGINVARGPGMLVLSPLGDTVRGQKHSATVPSMDYKTVDDARVRLLRAGAIAPASISQQMHQFYSVDDAMLKIGASASYLSASIQGQLESTTFSKKTNLMRVFTQQYYTLSTEDPSSPISFFAPSVTVNDLSPYANSETNPSRMNPTMYVSSVTYGRMGILLFSSDESYDKLKAQVDAAYSTIGAGANVSVSYQQQQLMKTTDIKLLMLGGDSNSGVRLVSNATDSFKAMNDWVSHPLSPRDIQLGVPISYRVNYLKDNSLAALSFSTKFTRTQISDIPRYTNYQIEFNTTDDDKDGDTQLRVEVLGPNNNIIADYQGSGGQNGAQYTYKNGSRNQLNLAEEAVMYVRDAPRSRVRIHIDPNGHDSWNFNFKVTALDSNTGSRVLLKSGSMNLSQHLKEDIK